LLALTVGFLAALTLVPVTAQAQTAENWPSKRLASS
jgi:hypothetical protein